MNYYKKLIAYMFLSLHVSSFDILLAKNNNNYYASQDDSDIQCQGYAFLIDPDYGNYDYENFDDCDYDDENRYKIISTIQRNEAIWEDTYGKKFEKLISHTLKTKTPIKLTIVSSLTKGSKIILKASMTSLDGTLIPILLYGEDINQELFFQEYSLDSSWIWKFFFGNTVEVILEDVVVPHCWAGIFAIFPSKKNVSIDLRKFVN